MQSYEWILCPICGNKTRDRIREDTVLKNYPLYCPKCKRESLIEAKDLRITVIKEPDAEPMICEVYHKFIGSFILTIKFHYTF